MEARNNSSNFNDRFKIRTCILVLVSLALIGCAQFKHQVPEQLPFMDRSQTKTDGEVRVTVAVPSAEESK